MLSDQEVSEIKGLLRTKKYRQCDIAAHYKINPGRIAEINTYQLRPEVRAASEGSLPKIKDCRPPTRTRTRPTIKDHCRARDRVINELSDRLCREQIAFDLHLRRIFQKYKDSPLTAEEKSNIRHTLQEISLAYQLLSQQACLA